MPERNPIFYGFDISFPVVFGILIYIISVVGWLNSYNATRHDTTSYSPFFLMFGRPTRLSVKAYGNDPKFSDR